MERTISLLPESFYHPKSILQMKNSPFQFQGNSSKQGKKGKSKDASEHDDAKNKQSLAPRELKKSQPKAKVNIPIRSARPVNTQRPKGKV
jgi:hypothetical protein